ncbi:LPXTG cell wall anchor domain-containing protein [Companilactobacillus furfuricola]|uniref:LPXTG cell wall anchor domain-containing protein n=1 Tax=Companilactobacillus furfuricola TaxID=1462575 RepID=UPI0013DDD44D|nr:LPXTG cell wall anchor domain-containing protein [Companilactobacillus furfuricola]
MRKLFPWLLATFAAVLFIFIGPTNISQAREITEVQGTQASDAVIKDENDEIISHDAELPESQEYTVNYQWSIPNSTWVLGGDTFKFYVPSNVKIPMDDSFQLTNTSSGKKIGSAFIAAGSHVGTVTLNWALADAQINKKGYIRLAVTGTEPESLVTTPNEGGNETVTPPDEGDTGSTTTPGEGGNETTTPPDENGNETTTTPDESGNETTTPDEGGGEAVTPPDEGSTGSTTPGEGDGQTVEPIEVFMTKFGSFTDANNPDLLNWEVNIYPSTNDLVNPVIKDTFNDNQSYVDDSATLQDENGNSVPFTTSVSGNTVTFTVTGTFSSGLQLRYQTTPDTNTGAAHYENTAVVTDAHGNTGTADAAVDRFVTDTSTNEPGPGDLAAPPDGEDSGGTEEPGEGGNETTTPGEGGNETEEPNEGGNETTTPGEGDNGTEEPNEGGNEVTTPDEGNSGSENSNEDDEPAVTSPNEEDNGTASVPDDNGSGSSSTTPDVDTDANTSENTNNGGQTVPTQPGSPSTSQTGTQGIEAIESPNYEATPDASTDAAAEAPTVGIPQANDGSFGFLPNDSLASQTNNGTIGQTLPVDDVADLATNPASFSARLPQTGQKNNAITIALGCLLLLISLAGVELMHRSELKRFEIRK